MSTSISNEQRLRAIHAEGGLEGSAKRSGRRSMVHWVTAVAILAGVSGVTLATIELATPRYLHLNAYSAACFILSGLAGAVLCMEWMLSDRQTYYQRGELSGWLKGWRGLPPDTDDPLLRR